MFGLVIFTLSTVLCGLASTGTLLIVYRLVQGVGAALALATGVPIIIRTFPKNELGRALGINSTSWVIGSIVGPVAGGALINAFGWRSIFFVTVPFAVMGIIAAAVVLPNTSQVMKAKTDWLGVVTFGGTLVALLLALSEGQAWGWSSIRSLGVLSAAIILLWIFVAVELRAKQPLFNLKLLSHGHFSTGLGITITYSIGYYATTFLLTLYLQGALHLNPLDAGLMLIPLSVPQLVMGQVGGMLSDRFGPIWLIFAGLILLAVGDFILGLVGPDLSVAKIVVPEITISNAAGLSWPSLQKATLAGVPSEEAGSASGMFYTFRNVGMSLSLTLALVIAELSVSPAVASEVFLGTGSILRTHVRTALVHAIDIGFRSFVLIFVACLIQALFLLRPHRAEKATGQSRALSENTQR